MYGLFLGLCLGLSLWAQTPTTVDYGYLKSEDQKYFKNDSREGNNQLERIDLNVKEINKLHGEITLLKAQMASLKSEIEKLKKKQ